jgi:hypothetical protein
VLYWTHNNPSPKAKCIKSPKPLHVKSSCNRHE